MARQRLRFGETPQRFEIEAASSRFECTEPLPRTPTNFRFAGVDGRGNQTLVRAPGAGSGAAIVRIEDSNSGAEGYTFDIFWNGHGWSGERSSVGPGDFRGGQRMSGNEAAGFARTRFETGQYLASAPRTSISQGWPSITTPAGRTGWSGNLPSASGLAGKTFITFPARSISVAAWYGTPRSTSLSGAFIRTGETGWATREVLILQ